MEERDDLLLRFGAEVDEQVAARNQIEPREWWIGQDVLHREYDRRAKLGQNPIAVIVFRKEPGKSRCRHICRNHFRVQAFTCCPDRVGVDIGGEDLQFDLSLRRCDLLAEEHGKRIGFLARTAPGDPYAERLIDGMVADQIGNDTFA